MPRGRQPPVTIDGTEYPSQSAAAKALGITPQAVWLRLHPEVGREAKTRYRKRRGALPKGASAKRWVRLTKDDMVLAYRLLRHFPACADINALCAHALHQLAATTDD